MKISEMTNDQATEALIRIAVPLSNICEDDEIVDIFNRMGNVDDIPLVKAIGQVVPDVIRYCLMKHKEDLYEVIGALTFQTKENVGKMNFIETVKVVKDSYDETLSSFFTRSARAMKKHENK